MEEKAQVNLEFLLIIVGSILIVTAVSIYIKNSANTAVDAINATTDSNA